MKKRWYYKSDSLLFGKLPQNIYKYLYSEFKIKGLEDLWTSYDARIPVESILLVKLHRWVSMEISASVLAALYMNLQGLP